MNKSILGAPGIDFTRLLVHFGSNFGIGFSTFSEKLKIMNMRNEQWKYEAWKHENATMNNGNMKMKT